MRMSWIGFLFAACAALPAPAANAQIRCLEGAAANGQCVNPALAEAARTTAIIFAQPKLSATAFPVLPSADRFYRYPYELVDAPQKPSPVGSFTLRVVGAGGKNPLVP